MDPSLSSTLLLIGAVFAIVAVGRVYFHRVRVERPPVGVFNLRDVVFVFVVLVLLPPLYLHLPLWLVATILVGMGTGLIYFTLTSVFGPRAAVPLAIALAVAEGALTVTGYGQSIAFGILNNIVVGLLVVGVCNIWAQSGIHAREVAIFAGAVAIYDLTATGFLPVMVEFFTRVQSLPYAPVLAFGHGTAAAGIGMGDLLFALLWPLVAQKAYSRRAGLIAAAGTLSCALALDLAFYFDVLNVPVPAMVVIGPVIIAQYRWFGHRYGRERTAGEYDADTRPGAYLPPAPPAVPVADLLTGLALAVDNTHDRPARYVAVHEGTILASGAQPGEVIRAARRARPSAVPVLVLAPLDSVHPSRQSTSTGSWRGAEGPGTA